MNFKRISSRFVAITAILFSLGGPLAQSANAMEPINFQNNYEQSIVSSDYSFSVESYKDWIKDKINMKNSNSNDAQIFLDEFNNLSEDEKELISFIFYNGNSAKDYSRLKNIPYTTVIYRRDNILRKLHSHFLEVNV